MNIRVTFILLIVKDSLEEAINACWNCRRMFLILA